MFCNGMFNSSATGVMTPLKPPDIRYTGTLRWCSTSTSRLQQKDFMIKTKHKAHTTHMTHITKPLFNNIKNVTSTTIVVWVMTIHSPVGG